MGLQQEEATGYASSTFAILTPLSALNSSHGTPPHAPRWTFITSKQVMHNNPAFQREPHSPTGNKQAATWSHAANM